MNYEIFKASEMDKGLGQMKWDISDITGLQNIGSRYLCIPDGTVRAVK